MYTKIIRLAKTTIFTKQICYIWAFFICFALIVSYDNYFKYNEKHKRRTSKEYGHYHEGARSISQLTVNYNERFPNEYKTNMSKFTNTKLVDIGEKLSNQDKWINIDSSKEWININCSKEHVKFNSSNCRLKNVTLSRISLPITGLVSFPGSGNTWVRHLIQQMTGTVN